MKLPIIILHGWAPHLSGKSYHELKSLLEKENFVVYTPDFPGFGTNPLRKEALTFEDYVAFLNTYITKILKQKKVILLGHSFGGRVAIRFTAQYRALVEKLILTGASGIPRPLPSLRKKIVYFVTKIARPLFSVVPFSFFYTLFRKAVYYSIGEMDYYKAGSLSATFKNVYQVSIVADLKKITPSTLIVWAENDRITPLADGKFMHRKIKNSDFVVVPNATHKLPYEKPQLFFESIKNFL